MATIFDELRTLVEQLSPASQQRVLEFAQGLVQTDRAVSSPLPTSPLPSGTPGRELLRFKLPQEDAEAIEKALEDCEKVEQDE